MYVCITNNDKGKVECDVYIIFYEISRIVKQRGPYISLTLVQKLSIGRAAKNFVLCIEKL